MSNMHTYIVANLLKNSLKLAKSYNTSNYTQKYDNYKD